MATIQGIYIALFGRPADPAGLEFFNEATNNGADLTAIGDLASTAEYQDRFTGMSNEEIVQSIYQSLFERDGEAEGVEFFVNGLEDGTFSINDIAIRILDGAQGSDLDTVNAKIAAADLFLERLDLDEEIAAYDGIDAADIVRQFFDSVDTGNVPDEAAIDALIRELLAQGGQNPGGGGAGDVVAPVFTSGALADVDENVAAGTLVYTAVATDDRGVPQLSLSGADAGAFTFDVNTGELKIIASPDFETKSSYSVDITATDFGGNMTVQTVTININDVNEAPVLTVTQVEDEVSENNGARVKIADLSTVDPDGDAISYSVNNANFEVDSGVLYLKAGIDYETDGATQTVTVTASDGSLTDTAVVSVDIIDVVETKTYTYNTVGNKTITDWVAGSKINVSAIDAKLGFFGSDPGNQAFSFGGIGSNADYGELVWRQEGSGASARTVIRADNTWDIWDLSDDLVITITGHHTLSAGDFIL